MSIAFDDCFQYRFTFSKNEKNSNKIETPVERQQKYYHLQQQYDELLNTLAEEYVHHVINFKDDESFYENVRRESKQLVYLGFDVNDEIIEYLVGLKQGELTNEQLSDRIHYNKFHWLIKLLSRDIRPINSSSWKHDEYCKCDVLNGTCKRKRLIENAIKKLQDLRVKDDKKKLCSTSDAVERLNKLKADRESNLKLLNGKEENRHISQELRRLFLSKTIDVKQICDKRRKEKERERNNRSPKNYYLKRLFKTPDSMYIKETTIEKEEENVITPLTEKMPELRLPPVLPNNDTKIKERLVYMKKDKKKKLKKNKKERIKLPDIYETTEKKKKKRKKNNQKESEDIIQEEPTKESEPIKNNKVNEEKKVELEDVEEVPDYVEVNLEKLHDIQQLVLDHKSPKSTNQKTKKKLSRRISKSFTMAYSLDAEDWFNYNDAVGNIYKFRSETEGLTSIHVLNEPIAAQYIRVYPTSGPDSVKVHKSMLGKQIKKATKTIMDQQKLKEPITSITTPIPPIATPIPPKTTHILQITTPIPRITTHIPQITTPISPITTHIPQINTSVTPITTPSTSNNEIRTHKKAYKSPMFKSSHNETLEKPVTPIATSLKTPSPRQTNRTNITPSIVEVVASPKPSIVEVVASPEPSIVEDDEENPFASDLNVSLPTAEDIEYLVQASKKPMFQMHVTEEDDPLTDEEDILNKYERERTLARRRRAVMLRSKLEKKKSEQKFMRMKNQKKEEPGNQPVNEELVFFEKFCMITSEQHDWFKAIYNDYLSQSNDDRHGNKLALDDAIDALQIVNKTLTSKSEISYILLILEAMDVQLTDTMDYQTFALLAAYSERIVEFRSFFSLMEEEINLTKLSTSFSKVKQLYQLSLRKNEHTIHTEDLITELQGVNLPEKYLNGILQNEKKDRLDFLDYVTYFPLFLLIHQNSVKEPY